VTVTDFECLDPVSQITGGRRYSFANDDGTYNLFKNLLHARGRHDYVEGSPSSAERVRRRPRRQHARRRRAAPPLSTGVLWDNLKVGQINIQDRGNSGTGHGHAGANQVIWNSTAGSFITQSPITAQNWLIGSNGTIDAGGGVGFHTPGLIDQSGSGSGTTSRPRSLYYQQLGERLAYENSVLREVRLGDADGFVAGDATDAVPVDAAWKSAIQSATGKTAVGFDDVAANHLVPFTFNYGSIPAPMS
jgi:hypothetical protein